MTNKELKNKLNSLRAVKDAVEPNALWVKESRALLLEKIKPVQVERVLPIVLPRTLGSRIMFAMRPIMASFMVIGFGAIGWAASVPSTLGSKPGDALYGLKTASEKAQLTFTADSSARAYLQLEFAGRRVNEMATLAESNDLDREANIVAAVSGLESEIKNMRENLNQTPTAAVAKAVDRKVAEIHAVFTKTKHLLSQNAQNKVDAVESMADDLSLKAVAVLVADAKSDDEKSDAATRVQDKIDVAERNLQVASTEAGEQAKAVLEQAKAALEQDNLTEAVTKVQESAAIVTADLPVAEAGETNANVNANVNAPANANTNTNDNTNTGKIEAIEQ